MENLTRRLSSQTDKSEGSDLLKVLTDVYERLRSVCFTSAGLAITGAGAATVSTGVAVTQFSTQGQLNSIAAARLLSPLAGTVVNATVNVFVFSIDKAQTIFTSMGTAGTAITSVRFPNVPPTHTVLGYVIINPTGTGNFVGGTTPLDSAGVVPNAVYVNTVGAFDVNATVV